MRKRIFMGSETRTLGLQGDGKCPITLSVPVTTVIHHDYF
jgi:hypothetical protein